MSAAQPLFLEATWASGALHLWGRIDDHPGATLGVDALRTAFSELAGDALLVSAVPAASLRIRPPGRTQPLEIEALAFEPADVLDLFADLRPSPAANGAGLRWWAGLAAFATSLLVRKQFIPDIESNGDEHFVGLWRPHISRRSELAWLETAAASMPGVCALSSDPGSLEGDPIVVVEGFIESAVDGFIRRVASEDPFFESIHQRAREPHAPEVSWMAALLGSDPSLPNEDPAGLAEFADRVRAWTGKLDDIGSPEDLQLGFELCEPDGDDLPWRVIPHLQTGDDGRRIDMARIWSASGGHPALLRRHLGRRRDRLLADFAAAEEAFPVLSRVSRHNAPEEVLINVDEAHTFIRDWAPLLRSRGFKVQLPKWAQHSDRQLGLRLVVRSPNANAALTGGHFGLDRLVNFDWRVAIGERDMSLEEFRALAAGGAPLIRYEDDWLEIDARDADAAMAFAQQLPQDGMTLRGAIQLAHGVVPVDTGLPLLGISGDDWLEDLLGNLSESTKEPPEQPPAFQGELRPYQLRGLGWLTHLDASRIGGCLADDMGLGKTIQIIALLLQEREAGPCGPTLLFAPTSVLGNWRRELQRFSPQLRARIHHGPERLTGRAFMEDAAQQDVIITTYALGHRDLETLAAVTWHRLVLDEAQKVKNPHAQQTLAIRQLTAGRRVALTGTPVENHLSDLWSIMEVLNPGLLGAPGHFRNHFVVPIEKMADSRRARQLRGLLRPFILRREKSDPDIIRDLPERLDMRVYCNLTPEQAGLYEETVGQMMSDIGSTRGIRRRGLVLSCLTRLKQICNHPAQVFDDGVLDDRSGKSERLIEMLEEVLAEGDSALVFTQYRAMGHLLERLIQKRLPTAGLQYLHGGTPQKHRERMIEHFQASKGGEIFLLSLRAGGFGVNLTAANHVFHFDRWWNPAVEDQATDRAHRMGQKRVVQVHKFVCIGTVEERIDRLLETKKAMAEQVVSSGEAFLTEMSTDELREYLSLSQEAVG